jgi:K+ transporter
MRWRGAVEGLEVAVPALAAWVVPVTVAILKRGMISVIEA